jgi:hypothetical protein
MPERPRAAVPERDRRALAEAGIRQPRARLVLQNLQGHHLRRVTRSFVRRPHQATRYAVRADVVTVAPIAVMVEAIAWTV